MNGLVTRSNEDHYVQVYLPNHPSADRDGWVLEHRVVYGLHLGGELPSGAVIHHLDRCRWNNSIENLLLCPSQDMHLALHRAIKGKDQGLAEAFIDWFRSLENELLASRKPSVVPRTCGAEDPNHISMPTMATHEEEVSKLGSRAEKLYLMVDQIGLINHKADRMDYLSPLFEQVSRQDLLNILTSRLDSASLAESLRIIWTIGKLGIEEAGPVLLRLVSASAIGEQRKFAWSALGKRHYRNLDSEILERSILQEYGQALQYGVQAITRNCPRDLALSTLERIEAMDLPPKQKALILRSTESCKKKLHAGER